MSKLILGLLWLACSTSQAGTIIDLTLDGNYPTDYSFYSYTATDGEVESDVPVGPYIAYLNGGSYDNTPVYTFCYDLGAPTPVGTAYPGTLETFTDPSDLEATFLVNELNGLGMWNAPAAARDLISLAIWQIMNPSSTNRLNPFPEDPAAQAYVNQAVTAVTNGWWTAADSAAYPTWVPEDPSLQRFAVVIPGVTPLAMPEPGSLILIGLGFVALGLVGRKRFRA